MAERRHDAAREFFAALDEIGALDNVPAAQLQRMMVYADVIAWESYIDHTVEVLTALVSDAPGFDRLPAGWPRDSWVEFTDFRERMVALQRGLRKLRTG